MKRLGVLVVVVVFTKFSYAGPDIKALIDYEKEDMEEAIVAEIAEISEKKETSLRDKKVDTKPLVTGLIDNNQTPKKIPTLEVEAKVTVQEKVNESVSEPSEDLAPVPSTTSSEKVSESIDEPLEDLTLEPALTSTSPVLESSTSEPIGIYFGLALTGMASNSQGRATLLSEEPGNDRQIAFTAKIGYDIVDNLSIELRGTHGMVNYVATPKFDNIAFYLKPNFSLSEDINLYVLLGYGKSNLAGSSDKVGFTYGAGVKYSALGNSEIFVDTINYLEKEGTNSMWGYNLGLEFKF